MRGTGAPDPGNPAAGRFDLAAALAAPFSGPRAGETWLLGSLITAASLLAHPAPAYRDLWLLPVLGTATLALLGFALGAARRMLAGSPDPRPRFGAAAWGPVLLDGVRVLLVFVPYRAAALTVIALGGFALRSTPFAPAYAVLAVVVLALATALAAVGIARLASAGSAAAGFEMREVRALLRGRTRLFLSLALTAAGVEFAADAAAHELGGLGPYLGLPAIAIVRFWELTTLAAVIGHTGRLLGLRPAGAEAPFAGGGTR